MNYYERHLGDYAKDTAHLTMIEHGAYSLLLDRYYGTEQGIPADQTHRIARARSREEKAAVDAILDEFFELVGGVWINQRAEEEIEKAKVRIEAAKSNGKRGGRPKKKPDGLESETQEKPTGFSLGSKNETQQKAHQAPDTRHHIKPLSAEVDSAVGATPAGIVCARLKEAGIPSVNPLHPKLLALLDAGLTVDEIVAVGPEAREKGKGFPWILATAEGRRRDAATTQPLPAKGDPPWWSSNDRMIAKGKTLGMAPRPGEDWPQFRERIHAKLAESPQPAAA